MRDEPADILEFEAVSMGYGVGEPPVIHNINYSIARGSVTTFFGKSGCGKSTLLNIAAGLFPPRTGTVMFNSKPLKGINRSIGYMTQEDTLLPWRTVRKNIEMPLRLRGVSKGDLREQVDTYLALLNLGGAQDKYPAQLSGGMRRRALLARTMIYQPEMLLLDEPFGGIDASLREGLHDELRRAVEQLEQTVLFVTHDIPEAALLSDKVCTFGAAPGQPTELRSEIDIPFGDVRDLDDIRKSEEFGKVQRELRLALEAANTPPDRMVHG